MNDWTKAIAVTVPTLCIIFGSIALFGAATDGQFLGVGLFAFLTGIVCLGFNLYLIARSRK